LHLILPPPFPKIEIAACFIETSKLARCTKASSMKQPR
jgi:hypothetical protein